MTFDSPDGGGVGRAAGEPYAREVADVHRMFRREFQLLPDVVLAVGHGDEARARLVGAWVWDVLDSLHHYRYAQVLMLWPVLRQRMPHDEVATEVVSRTQRQLAALDPPRGTAQAAALRWQDGGGGPDAYLCGTTMAAMRRPLADALSLVEEQLGPVIDGYLTAPERSGLVSAAWLGARGRRRRAILGGVLEGTSEPEHVLSQAPAVLRWLAAPVVVEPHTRRMMVVRQRGPVD